jgi:beta-glucanase (GH16 family)
MVVLVVAILGYATLQISHAATFSTSVEAESGTLSGNASIISDSTASGSSAVKFAAGTGTSTGGCTVSGAVAPCMSDTASGTGTSGYSTPVFDDEFNGTSLDTTSWIPGRRLGSGACTSACAGYNPSAEEELFDSSKVSESGGSLNLAATNTSLNGGKNPWTSGAAEMKQGKNFVDGYFEARIKVPLPTDAWTAYWLTTAGSTWPPELDIFEFSFCNSQPTFNNHGTVAGNGVNAAGWPCGEAYGSSSTDFTQWHTYGLLWTSSSVKVYLDGVLQSSLTTSGSGDGIPTTPMYPIFDYAIGQGDNPPNNSQMNIDYLRIWCPGGGTSCMTSNT